jgi:hypothetical protein
VSLLDRRGLRPFAPHHPPPREIGGLPFERDEPAKYAKAPPRAGRRGARPATHVPALAITRRGRDALGYEIVRLSCRQNLGGPLSSLSVYVGIDVACAIGKRLHLRGVGRPPLMPLKNRADRDFLTR